MEKLQSQNASEKDKTFQRIQDELKTQVTDKSSQITKLENNLKEITQEKSMLQEIKSGLES